MNMDLEKQLCHTITFETEGYAPVVLQQGTALSESLDVMNSPILFGCRTGICGTCAIEVTSIHGGALPPRNEDEDDTLEIIAPNSPNARLACQISATASMCIRKLANS